MKFANKKKKRICQKRVHRVRKLLAGTAQRPRMSIVKSSKHLYAQLIDDVTGSTLVSVSSMEKELRVSGSRGRSVASGRTI